MPGIKKNKPSQKIILVFITIVVFTILLELGLNIAGFILFYIQENRNQASLREKGGYRIVCIGESTTALGGDNSYPAQLEKILNEKIPGLKISVINKGTPAIDSSAIVEQLEGILNKAKPDMVVAMIGINDFNPGLSYGKKPVFWEDLKTYKMLKLVLQGISGKTDNPELSIERKEDNGLFGNFSEDYLKKETQLNPGSDFAHLQLANFYSYGEREKEAKPLFEKAIQLNPLNDYAYAGLGRCYRRQGDLAEAEKLFKKSVELNPNNEQACMELGMLYYNQGSRAFAEDYFKRVLGIKPHNYIKVGSFYISQGDNQKAEELFKNVLSAGSDDSRVYGMLGLLYAESNDLTNAKKYSALSRQMQLKYINTLTGSNYSKIKDILDQRGIRLVCVQYPMRSVQPLKRMFAGKNGIIFVDNEAIFRKAIEREGIKEFFWDMFAGDFGHCTAKGNNLIARNIAGAIIEAGIFPVLEK